MATLAKGGRPAVNSIPFRLHLCPYILFLHLQTSGSSDRVRRWILNMLVSARHRSLNMVSDLTSKVVTLALLSLSLSCHSRSPVTLALLSLSLSCHSRSPVTLALLSLSLLTRLFS